MRSAIVHYWLLGMRGGEAVVEALCRMLPDADIFTLFYQPEMVSPLLRSRRIVTSFLNPLRNHYRSLLPLMPMALESFDLRGYDLVVSSESGPAKGVIVPSAARHVCYCHTPMRYLWDLYPAYRNEFTRSRFMRSLMTPLANYLRLWDYASAARVDRFVANSRNVQRRVRKTYRRRCTVIYPPVAVERFHCEPAEDYFLTVGELVQYKRFDVAVRAFARNGRRLRLAGDGPQYRELRRLASPNVEFLGRVRDDELRTLYARCRAFVMPGEEDFGITAVEAQASGKPVIALGRGGVLESVPPEGGIFFEEAEPTALEAALREFEQREASFDGLQLQSIAERFSTEVFESRMAGVLFRLDRDTREQHHPVV